MDEAVVSKLVAMMEGSLGKAHPPLRRDLRVVRPQTAAERATEAWQWHEANATGPVNTNDVDQSARARNIRTINRIALRYQWGEAVANAVDRASATSLQAMNDDQVQQLADYMMHLVDCAQSGCDPSDDLPAR